MAFNYCSVEFIYFFSYYIVILSQICEFYSLIFPTFSANFRYWYVSINIVLFPLFFQYFRFCFHFQLCFFLFYFKIMVTKIVGAIFNCIRPYWQTIIVTMNQAVAKKLSWLIFAMVKCGIQWNKPYCPRMGCPAIKSKQFIRSNKTVCIMRKKITSQVIN